MNLILRICILTLAFVTVVVNGLECDICHREGDDGDKSCDRKPCNTPEDVEVQTRLAPSQGEFHVDKTRTNCVKVLYSKNLTKVTFPLSGPYKMGKIDVVQLPLLEAYCAFADTRFPPRNESYPNYPESEAPGPGIRMDSTHVCDEETVDNCRVSNDELNRGVAYSFYTRAGKPGIWTTAHGDGGLWLLSEYWPINFIAQSPEMWRDYTKFRPMEDAEGNSSELEDVGEQHNSADEND